MVLLVDEDKKHDSLLFLSLLAFHDVDKKTH